MSASRFRPDSPLWPLLAIVAIFAAQAMLIATRAINWDEFFYYMQVAQAARGELDYPINTVHVWAFGWLPQIADNSVDAIIAARIVMLGFEALTLLAIYWLAGAFASRSTALLAALAYVSAGFVIQHGFSFRVDPSLTALAMLSLAVLARSSLRLGWLIVFAALVGLAGMVSVKLVLLGPAYLGVAWYRWSQAGLSRAMALRLFAGGALALAAFGVLYAGHSALLAAGADDAAVQGNAANVMSNAGQSVFFIGVPPYAQMIVKAVSLALLLAMLIAIAPVAIARRRPADAARWALLGLWLPVLTLLFYRNTAPYYYVFMLAPVVVGCVTAIDWARQKLPVAIISALFAVLAVPVVLENDGTVIASQRAVAMAGEAMFDRSTPYFDHNGMLAGHRKANGFMTPWGLEGYQRHGKSLFRTIMEREAVPMLLENDPLLVDLLQGDGNAGGLYPEDRRVLRDNYLPVWGPIWLAGKTVPAGSARESEWLVPGRYRIEGATVAIDGDSHAPGATIRLERGRYRLANEGGTEARLIWADARLPQGDPPQGRLWIGF